MYLYNSNYLLKCANVMLNYRVMELCYWLVSQLSNVCRLNFDKKLYSFVLSTKIKQNPKYTNSIDRLKNARNSLITLQLWYRVFRLSERVSVSVITVGVRGPRDNPDNTAEILSSHGGSGERGCSIIAWPQPDTADSNRRCYKSVQANSVKSKK